MGAVASGMGGAMVNRESTTAPGVLSSQRRISRNPSGSSYLHGDPEPSDSGLQLHCPRRSPGAHSSSTNGVSNNSEENVPMSKQLPVRAEVAGLAELLLS